MLRPAPPVVPPGSLRASAQPELTAAVGLLLRPWQPDDAGDVAAVLTAFADPEIQRWGMRNVADAGQARRWMRGWAAGWEAETDACWAVVHDGVVVGRAALRRLDLAGGSGQIAFWVLPVARGRGVASTSAAEVARWAFEKVGLRRVELWHAVDNEGSCGVARRLAFALEGTRRDGMLLVDGWHDMHRHGRAATG